MNAEGGSLPREAAPLPRDATAAPREADLLPCEDALVHGLAGDRVAPDWPPLTDAHARWIAERWALAATMHGPPDRVRVLWRSPRPLSAAGLIGTAHAAVFVKRHDRRVRDARSLVAEHRFASHLRAAGLPVPEVLATPDGRDAVEREEPAGSAVYEVHARAPGIDVYREADSWTGFLHPGHARAAGALLGRLHRAADGFELEGRRFGPLVDCVAVIAAADPLAAVAALADARPGLRSGLAGHPWRRELADAFGPMLGEAARHLRNLPRAWTHGDWHPSNLTWSAAGEPVAVLDLGLSNRTTPVRDVAIAIERSCVSWLEPVPVADLVAVRALLDGYTALRPLSDAEWAALPALTATAHVEFALSEIEYYAGVLGSSERAEVAYRDYLVGHARWFASEAGRALLAALGARLTG